MPLSATLLEIAASLLSQPYSLTAPAFLLLVASLWLSLVNPLVLLCLALYASWAWFLDTAPLEGKRAWLQPRIRAWPLTRRIVRRLGGEVVLDAGWKSYAAQPGERYLFCTHPHGAFGNGTWAALMLTESFAEAFPELVSVEKGYCRLRGTTVTAQFALPFVREMVLAGGVMSASPKAMETWLKGGDKGESRAMYLVPGGAAEQAYVGSNRLVLHRRKGLVRMAMRTGAKLVPVWIFGENELYPPPPRGMLWDAFSGFCKKWLGWMPVPGTPPFLLLPRVPQKGLKAVVGTPIAVPRGAEGDPAVVDKWLAVYIAALRSLWERHRGQYGRTVEGEFELRHLQNLPSPAISLAEMPSGDTPPALPPFSDWDATANSVTRHFLTLSGRPDVVSLAGGLPAAELYPLDLLKEASAKAIERHGAKAAEYGPCEGMGDLRQLVADRMSDSTGGCFTADNVILTTGAMQALDLLGKILLDPGEKVVAQFPTYLGALDAWRPRRPGYAKLDWDAPHDAMVAVFREAKFVYAVPNYSNPTGALVPEERRRAVLAAALEANVWLVEDDPYEALQLDGPAPPSLISMDASARAAERPGQPYDGPVVYLGTLSKSLVPGLRVGWAAASPAMMRQLALAKSSADLASSSLCHAIAYELLLAGADVAHGPVIRDAYKRRRDALAAALGKEIGEWFEWELPPGGMFIWARAKPGTGIDTDALYGVAGQEGVAFVPSSVFDPEGNLKDGMRLNFSRNGEERLEEGARRLGSAVRRYLEEKKRGTQGDGGSTVEEAMPFSNASSLSWIRPTASSAVSMPESRRHSVSASESPSTASRVRNPGAASYTPSSLPLSPSLIRAASSSSAGLPSGSSISAPAKSHHAGIAPAHSQSSKAETRACPGAPTTSMLRKARSPWKRTVSEWGSASTAARIRGSIKETWAPSAAKAASGDDRTRESRFSRRSRRYSASRA
ncbi:pyridoxal phosphate-dependent transferase [Hyaloraphidium curvatum]|nr:pyridoxal phosphate-dependent transferase [Hyaloraphidium curvatum]